MSMEYPELIAAIRDEKFVEIYGSCSRKIRNMLESMYVKKLRKKKKVSLKSTKDRTRDALAVRDGIVGSDDEQMAEEILKTWLYDKRDLLSASLDFFEIPNEDGITEGDLDPLESADAAKLGELVDKLEADGQDIENIAIYLAFMQAEHFEEVERLQSFLVKPE